MLSSGHDRSRVSFNRNEIIDEVLRETKNVGRKRIQSLDREIIEFEDGGKDQHEEPDDDEIQGKCVAKLSHLRSFEAQLNEYSGRDDCTSYDFRAYLGARQPESTLIRAALKRAQGRSLGISACDSLLAFYLTCEKTGKLQLPTNVEESEDGHDPFDVTTPEDVIDGYPTNTDTFWVLASIFTHLLGLALRSVNQDTSSLHSESILHWHLTTLTILASLLLSAIAILPDAQLITTPAEVVIPMVWCLWYARLGLYIVLCVMTNDPLSGTLWIGYMPKKLELQARIPQNVSGYVGDSPWGILVFSYTTSVIIIHVPILTGYSWREADAWNTDEREQ
ncbi:hypothetical protein L208DRAFT_1459361 [Tricholoma matsutake]|nr:hypothetical protein L208DRAFT_1459361 [Tricholoma matsutake 945]